MKKLGSEAVNGIKKQNYFLQNTKDKMLIQKRMSLQTGMRVDCEREYLHVVGSCYVNLYFFIIPISLH